MTQVCRKCGIEKDYSEYHRERRVKRGITAQCKTCRHITSDRWRRAHPMNIALTNRKHYYTHWEYRRAESKRYRAEDPNSQAILKEQNRRYKLNNPEKTRVRRLVYKAVKSGRLKRLPCGICGNTKSEAHHADYTQPFLIEWLCRKHHMELHRTELTYRMLDSIQENISVQG